MITALACWFVANTPVYSQAVAGQDGARKIKVVSRPDYPPLATRLNLTGVVKVEVTIAPDGKVKSARILGGHPVFAAEAEKAALHCEFEAGPKETIQVMEFKFAPGQN
jgi:TonB family protein